MELAKKKNKILFLICIPHDSSCDIDRCFREAASTSRDIVIKS